MHLWACALHNETKKVSKNYSQSKVNFKSTTVKIVIYDFYIFFSIFLTWNWVWHLFTNSYLQALRNNAAKFPNFFSIKIDHFTLTQPINFNYIIY